MISWLKLLRFHESKPWNPIIASVFYRAGIIEKWGSGTLNIIERCEKNGNPLPTWEVRTESVVTTFFPSTFFLTGKHPEEKTEILTIYASEKEEQVNAKVGFDPLELQKMIMTYIEEHKSIKRAKVADLCNIGPHQATRLLKKLATEGKIILRGRRKGAFYERNI